MGEEFDRAVERPDQLERVELPAEHIRPRRVGDGLPGDALGGPQLASRPVCFRRWIGREIGNGLGDERLGFAHSRILTKYELRLPAISYHRECESPIVERATKEKTKPRMTRMGTK